MEVSDGLPSRTSAGMPLVAAHAPPDEPVVDAEGRLLARRRIRDDAAGYQQLLQLLAEAGDTATDPIPVAIETSRGLLVSFLRATGRRVYAINPLAVSRYRDRHGVAGAKSDHSDAVLLAGILRTDQAAPAAASRLRAGPGDHGAGPHPAGRGLEPPAAGHEAALAAAGVLPRRPGGLPA
jgi:hypothetical protein